MTVNVNDIRMDLDIEIGSPSGMGQLIRYFEIQSQRLDRQSLVTTQSATSCLNSQFESLIKFDGVPILAPAMTSSRREALKQHKKDAVLLEKKLKMRQRRHHKAGSDDSNQAQLKHPSSPGRSAVRQLNFDSGVSDQDSTSNSSALRQRLGATNPLSTYATADLAPRDNPEDFGLRTMDSVNSDFASLEESHLPTVFSGHALKSVKEQKISYNLDHLCKELNVQDLGSTSGSDLSDALANTREMLIGAGGGNSPKARGDKWAQRVRMQRGAGHEGGGVDVPGLSFCHESQDTVVEVSPDAGSNAGADYSSTSGFVEKSSQSSNNFEQTQTSIGSSPGCGSACTSDSQKSKVHFASFILEYNTSASQSLESTTVTKKKMSPSEIRESVDNDGTIEDENKQSQQERDNWKSSHTAVTASSHAKSSFEMKGKTSLSRKISDEGSPGPGGLLNRVSLQHDSDMSPTTPPYESAGGVPFQNYGSSGETGNSDKENDMSRVARHHYQDRSSPKAIPTTDHSSRQRESPDHHHHHHHNNHKNRVKRVSSDASDRRGESHRHRTSSLGVSSYPTPPADMKSFATGGMGSALPPTSSSAVSVGANQLSTTTSCDSDNLVSVSQVSLGLHSSGVGSAANQQSVSDSQTSSARSTTLTGTSGSSSSTIKEDLTPKNATSLGMNIIDGGSGHAELQGNKGDLQTIVNNDTIEQDKTSLERKISNTCDSTKDKLVNMAPNISPKRLNTDNQTKDADTKESSVKTTPKQSHVRRGSYTLSHPSPALLQARGRMEDDEAKEKSQDDDKEKCSVSSGDENLSPAKPDDTNLKKRLDFNELIQDLEETSVNHDSNYKYTSKEVANNSNVPSDPEKEGKAEHIDKYLRHVQFQNSMNLQSLDPDQSLDIGGDEGDVSRHELQHNNLNDYNNIEGEEDEGGGGEVQCDDEGYILSVLQSIADSQSSVGRLNDLEVQTLHQKQMEMARQALVEQQRKDMEELFVQQRREILKFESEIRMAQQQSLEQHKFLVQNAPENLKIKSKNYEDEYSPENTGNLNIGSYTNNHRTSQQNNSMNSVDNMRPQSTNRVSFNEHHSSAGYPGLNLQQKSYPSLAPKPTKPNQSNRRGVSASILSSKSLEAVSDHDHHYQQTNSKRTGNLDAGYSSHHPHHHRSHNVLSQDPSYSIPEFGSPSVSSPRMHRKVNINYSELHRRRNGPVTAPPQAYHPDMKPKFDRVTAVAKGFLTRCLMKSDKVQDLVKTIKDTCDFFVNFQTETPIKKGNITSQDKALMERIQAQLQGAKFDIHEIFFDLSNGERMALIEQTRVKEHVKKVKSSRDSTDVSRASGPRMSQATLKALERKRKAREAEAIAILSTSTSSSLSRPKTGSSSNSNSPRCQNHTDGRALKPLQGQHHHVTASNKTGSISNNKDKKDKPQTGPEKQLTRPKKMTVSSTSSKQSSSSSSHLQAADTDRDSGLTKPTASTTAKSNTKSRIFPSTTTTSSNSSTKPTGRPTKSWR